MKQQTTHSLFVAHVSFVFVGPDAAGRSIGSQRRAQRRWQPRRQLARPRTARPAFPRRARPPAPLPRRGLAWPGRSRAAAVAAQDRDTELERIQTLEGATPLAAAVAADALAHSLPGLNLLLTPASELFGAAAGVAYLMSVLLSSPSVDPGNLAPRGTVINAETAAARAPARRRRPLAAGPTAAASSACDYV